MQEVQNLMFVLADKLKQKRDEKKEIESKLKELNTEIEAVEAQLFQLMLEEEIQSFQRSGYTFYMQVSPYPSVLPEIKEEFYNWLKENGYGSLIQETINHNSLRAWVKEILEENGDELPEELQPILKIFEKQTVGIRKAKREVKRG